jgi:hypothetical protein
LFLEVGGRRLDLATISTSRSIQFATALDPYDSLNSRFLDFDGDGTEEMLYQAPSQPFPHTSMVEVYRLKPEGTLVKVDTLPTTDLPFAAVDIDGDGQTDLIANGTSGPVLLLRRGAGYQERALPSMDGPFTFGDFDGDGKIDLIASRRSLVDAEGALLAIYRGDGNGGFSIESEVRLGNVVEQPPEGLRIVSTPQGVSLGVATVSGLTFYHRVCAPNPIRIGGVPSAPTVGQTITLIVNYAPVIDPQTTGCPYDVELLDGATPVGVPYAAEGLVYCNLFSYVFAPQAGEHTYRVVLTSPDGQELDASYPLFVRTPTARHRSVPH